MVVRVRCPNPGCRQLFFVDESRLGRKGGCSVCGQVFLMQAEETTHNQESSSTPSEKTAPPLSSKHQPTRVGRFQIRALLGTGAFGAVYRAYDPKLDREIGLKVPHADVLEKKQLERFLREARAAARLRHPNIVPVFEIGQDGDRYYIVTAFIPGQSLEDAIEGKGLEFRRAARIVRALAEGVSYAHSQGIIHRDIKPSNVMLDERDQPLLMDFGLAARLEGSEKLTQTGTILGTPAYMAPEQAQGKQGEPQPASDQYSLGVVLYELLTGRTPFEGPPAVVLLNALTTPPDRPGTLRADVPAELEAICLKALAKKPEERYADCQALADTLNEWLENWGSQPVGRDPDKVLEFEETTTLQATTAFAPPKGTFSGLPRSGISETWALVRSLDWKYWNLGLVVLGLVFLMLGVVVIVRYWKGNEAPPSPVAEEEEAVEIPQMAVSPFNAEEAKKHLVNWGKYLKVPVETTNTFGMKFVLIPPGTFIMGSPPGEPGRQPDGNDETQHQVTLTKAYYLGSHEVTRGQFSRFIKETSYRTEAEINGGSFVFSGGTFVLNPTQNWQNPGFAQTDEHPVVCISWNDCAAFLKWINQHPVEKGYYRLPTEAEWEYACRCGTTSEFSTGNGLEALQKVGWCSFDGVLHSAKGTKEVGSFDPNPWGLYDMHGNAFEWCQDWFSNYDKNSTLDPLGSPTGSRRTRRGGCWSNNHWKDCRSATRGSGESAFRDNGLGFRLVNVFSGELTVKLSDKVDLDLILIRPGSFVMGSNTGSPEEKPAHKVTITKAFFLGKYEVTQEQWEAVMGSNPSLNKGGKNPVERVSWEDCQIFGKKLNEKFGPSIGTFRLPTEAEWEYACRAGRTTKYFFGDEESRLEEYGNFAPRRVPTTIPVGQKKPNAWGLYDMHGNVWEWCQDWYRNYDGDEVDPTGASEGSYRVLRGGAFSIPRQRCGSGNRFRSKPEIRSGSQGCRLALSPPGY